MVWYIEVSRSLLAWLDDLARVNHGCNYLSTSVVGNNNIWLRNGIVYYEVIDVIVGYDVGDVLLVLLLLELFLFGIRHLFWVNNLVVISNILYLNVIRFIWKRFGSCFIVTCLALVIEIDFGGILRVPNPLWQLRVVSYALFIQCVAIVLILLVILRARR